ncbi:helix-turn-helix domain-containing protein [Streptomyces sp. DSM 41982]|uniref:Helix-turn-helix domain-containing protein n=1 Tax=Streptomyces evansiae TaxID=3075535 RepID=A0ABD5E9N5_9ACTN|nr:helix-turn-helix domain-containing protein [Streptomyces sp. DSM 41982]MDT0418068.1 helix-turn-helix domain-containing protein [Streptomyces sp. DSM 41982]
MARWEGNTRGRLERAALDLFTEQGYDRTTVAEIARRAGLTERSFYRWYTDKREALFGGGQELEELLVAAVAEVPEGTAPLDTLLRAFTKAPEVFRPREFLRARAAVIAASPPLRERELIKTASMSAALKKALENRGHPPAPARLATDAAMAIVRVAGERWAADESADYETLLRAAEGELRAIVCP